MSPALESTCAGSSFFWLIWPHRLQKITLASNPILLPVHRALELYLPKNNLRGTSRFQM